MSKDNAALLLGAGVLALGLYAMSNSSKPDTSHGATTNEPHGSSASSLKSPSDFVKNFYKHALSVTNVTKFPIVNTLTQAGVESNWGHNAFGNNFFGEKADKHWTGETQLLKTWECGKTGNPKKDNISDTIIKIYAPGEVGANPNCSSAGLYSYRVWGKFRAYETPAKGLYAHVMFLQDNHRYKPALAVQNYPTLFFPALQKAGYATAPNYGEMLSSVALNVQKTININNLASKYGTPTSDQGKW